MRRFLFFFFTALPPRCAGGFGAEIIFQGKFDEAGQRQLVIERAEFNFTDELGREVNVELLFTGFHLLGY